MKNTILRVVILLLYFICSTVAKTTTWTGLSGDSQWGTAGNWDNGVPGYKDDVTINNKGVVVGRFNTDVVLTSLTLTGGSTLWMNVSGGDPGYNIDSLTVTSSYFYIGAAVFIKTSTLNTAAMVVFDQFQITTYMETHNTAFYADLTTPNNNPNFYFFGASTIILDQTNITSMFMNLESPAVMEIHGTFYFTGIGKYHYMQCGGIVYYRGDISPVVLYSDRNPTFNAWVGLATSQHIILGKVLFNNLAYSTDGLSGPGTLNVTSGIVTFNHPGQLSNLAIITGTSSGRLILQQGNFSLHDRVDSIRLTIVNSQQVNFPNTGSLVNIALDLIGTSIIIDSRTVNISAMSIGSSGSVTLQSTASLNYLSVFPTGNVFFRSPLNVTSLYIASGTGANFQAGSTSCMKYFIGKSGSTLAGIAGDSICGCNIYTPSANSVFKSDYTCGGSYPPPPAVPPIDGMELPDGFATTAAYVEGGSSGSTSVGLIVGIVVAVVVVLVVVVIVVVIIIKKRNGGSSSFSSSYSSSTNNNNRNDVELRNNTQNSSDYEGFRTGQQQHSSNISTGSSGGRLPPSPPPPGRTTQDSYGSMPTHPAANRDQTGYKAVPGRPGANPPSKQTLPGSKGAQGPPKPQNPNRNARDQSFSSLDNPWMIDPKELVYGSEIGRGAFGVVFKGQWRKGAVAIKQLLTQNSDENDFRKEVKLMMNLRPHGNVVQFYGITVDPLAVVCEFLQLGSLLSMLRSDARIPPDKINRIIVGIARGMFHLHSEKIIHRDLAARNVLLNSDWEPKITDFGLSRINSAEDDNTTQSNTGPLKWMAPECLQLRKYSKKSDVWAYGITLIEILTRQSPYGNLEAIQVAAMVMYGDLKPEIPSNATPKVKKVMELCFKNEYSERPEFDAIIDFLK